MKKRKKIIVNFIIIISVILLIISLGLILYNNYKINNYIKEETKINEVISNKLTNKELIENFKEEFNNNDIVGILNISDIINIPIPQANDNNHYLKYGLGNKKVYGGSPFIDYRTPLKSKQINIYGHNSTRYDLPFKQLEKYLDAEYIQNNDIIELKTEDKTYKYIITYVYIEPKKGSNEHYKYEYTDEITWKKHLLNMKEKSFYINENEIQAEDNILILQTCLFGENRNKFLLIVAKQIN